MPTYEYLCKTCGHRFEEFQSIAESPLTECPKCGGLVERLISGGAGLLFKGSGFYITDYRSESYKKAESREKTQSTPAATGSDTKPSSSAGKSDAS